MSETGHGGMAELRLTLLTRPMPVTIHTAWDKQASEGLAARACFRKTVSLQELLDAQRHLAA